MVERRMRRAGFPRVKSRDSFEFAAITSINKTLVLELARCEYVTRRDNVIAVGNSGTGKPHIALGLGRAACQKGLSVGFVTAAALVHELIEARDEKRLLRLQRQLAGYNLLIIDELGYVPLSTTGAELLFEVFSQRYERGSTIVTLIAAAFPSRLPRYTSRRTIPLTLRLSARAHSSTAAPRPQNLTSGRRSSRLAPKSLILEVVGLGRAEPIFIAASCSQDRIPSTLRDRARLILTPRLPAT